MKDLLDDQLEEDNLIRTYKKVSDMIICPTLSCIADLSKAEALAQQELQCFKERGENSDFLFFK